MAPKRPREEHVTSAASKRKRRSHAHTTGGPEATPSSVGAGKPVSVDELSWKPVPLPDRLEDAEGFFGLEEIEGVDVVKRHGEEGKVEYRVKTSSSLNRSGRREAVGDAEGRSDDEWEGFGSEGRDEELQGGAVTNGTGSANGKQKSTRQRKSEGRDEQLQDGAVTTGADTTNGKQKSTRQKRSEKQTRDKKSSQNGSTSAPSNAFATLEGVGDDEEVDGKRFCEQDQEVYG